jgi:hypothetical protein
MMDRADPHARERALLVAREDPPPGDMRKGFASLSLQLQEVLRRDPLSGHLQLGPIASRRHRNVELEAAAFQRRRRNLKLRRPARRAVRWDIGAPYRTAQTQSSLVAAAALCYHRKLLEGLFLGS